MADNIELDTPGTPSGIDIRTDDDGTAHWQYVKIAYGADNTQNIVTSTATNPLPVALSDTDNAVLDNIQTAVELIDNAVSGAGFNITQLGGAAVPIGAGVEATSVRVTIATDSTGVVSIDDNGGSLTVDGTVTANLSATDNAVLDSIDAAVNGTLTVGSHAVTNAGTFAVQEDGAALTALQLIDDPVFADDAAFTLASSKVMMSGAIRDDSLTTLTAIEGDAVPLRVSSTGALHVTGGGGGTEYNDDVATPATITGTATVMERDDTLSTLTPIEGDWAAMRCSAEGALWVQEFNSDAILADTANMDTNLGTIAGAVSGTEMQVDVLTLPASTNTLEVVGDVAHDAAAAGNPVAIAARATNSIEGLTQVAAADATYLTSDLNGCIVTRPHTTLEENISERISDTAGTSTNFTNFGAGGAGIHNYITSATVYNSHASTSGYVDLRDGSAGSILWTLPAPASGGCVQSFDPPLKQTTANTALAYDVSAAITTVYLSCNGFQAQG